MKHYECGYSDGFRVKNELCQGSGSGSSSGEGYPTGYGFGNGHGSGTSYGNEESGYSESLDGINDDFGNITETWCGMGYEDCTGR